MSFIAPAYLYGLLLLSIPVIIHFFNFQRARRVYFTNVAFLQSVKSVTNARNKLKHLLVLAARLLFLAFLILAFARPYLPKDNIGQEETAQGNYVSIYLDNSYSMENEQDGKRLFDIGKSSAEQLSDLFPSNALFHLIDNSFAANSNFFFESGKLADRLAELGYAGNDRDMASVYSRQLGAMQANSSSLGNQIFWISDFQKSTKGNLSEIQLDTLNSFYLLPLQPNNEANLYIDSVWLDRPFIKPRENNQINIRIVNQGTKAVDDRPVKLYLQDKQASSATVNVAAGSSEILSLTFAVDETGIKQGYVSLEDYPVTFDNEYYFTLRIAPNINIVHIVEKPSVYIPSVYENEPFFSLSQYVIGSLDFNALQTADLIILESLADIDEALVKAVNTAKNRGAHVVIFPPATALPPAYTSLSPLAAQGLEAEPNQDMIGVRSPDPNNPFFEGVFEKFSANMSMPVAIPFVRWQGMSNTLLSFRTGIPFLLQTKRGNSQTYLFSTPLDPQYTNLSKHAVFVPIMYKIAIASKVRSERMAFSFNESVASVSLEEGQGNDVLKLVSEQTELVPPQRMVGNNLVLDIPKGNISAGLYQIKNTQGAEELRGSIAFNYAKSESELTYYTTEELEAIFEGQGNVQIFNNVNDETFAKRFEEQNVSVSLWRYFLLMALLFLLVEVLLIRFWKTASV